MYFDQDKNLHSDETRFNVRCEQVARLPVAENDDDFRAMTFLVKEGVKMNITILSIQL